MPASSLTCGRRLDRAPVRPRPHAPLESGSDPDPPIAALALLLRAAGSVDATRRYDGPTRVFGPRPIAAVTPARRPPLAAFVLPVLLVVLVAVWFGPAPVQLAVGLALVVGAVLHERGLVRWPASR